MNLDIKTRLIERIKTAFSTVPYPGDQNITIHPLGLDIEIEEYFRGKTWQGLSEEKLRYHLTDALGIFSPEGYHYFLPAFLIFALDGNDDAGWYIGFSLERGEKGSTIKGKTQEQLFLERIRLFSKDQLGTIADFFQYLIEEEYCDDEIQKRYQNVIANLKSHK